MVMTAGNELIITATTTTIKIMLAVSLKASIDSKKIIVVQSWVRLESIKLNSIKTAVPVTKVSFKHLVDYCYQLRTKGFVW